MFKMMKAGVASERGLELRGVPTPIPRDQEILVRVAAAGVNRADIMAATGLYGGKDSLGKPIGMEWAGEVVDVGNNVTGFKPGDMVMASGMGGFAEYAVSDSARTFKIGDRDVTKAAGLPLALLTAYDALVINGRLSKGGSILVQGASSAVGLMSMQIAKHIGARTIIGTSSNELRRRRLSEFGATMALDTRAPDWSDRVLEATGGAGVDLVVDMVSGKTVNGSMKATSIAGRIVNVGRLGGASAEFDFNLHAARRITYIGVTFRTRSVEEVREISRRTHEAVWELFARGELVLPFDRTFRLAQAKDALAYMESNAHFGKIVLVP